MTDSAHILIVTGRHPLQGMLAREVLDAVLACTTFELGVDVLFCGDAVWQLVARQAPSPAGGKLICDAWRAAPLYDIRGLHAEADALAARGLTADDLIPEAQLASAEQIRGLLATSDRVLSF